MRARSGRNYNGVQATQRYRLISAQHAKQLFLRYVFDLPQALRKMRMTTVTVFLITSLWMHFEEHQRMAAKSVAKYGTDIRQ